jgi:DNA repair exonuclease SbcCD ATPase subunit
MQVIRLNKLRLKNFKGIKNLSLDLQGRDTIMYGTNATGKTSIYDSFLWLLFGKDSQGKAEFDIKTLDENNNPISGLEHEVEAELDIYNGDKAETLLLKKIFREKWVKRKGSATSEFTGHTTDYFINDVPAKKKEWDARIKEITDEDTFKLLTSSRYFNEQLAWKTRRDILLSVCGDVPDADVIASKEELAELKKILGNRPLEDHRKMIAARRKKINDQLEKIPVRIDEVAQNMPDISEIDSAIIHRNIGQHKFDKAAAEKEKLALESGGQAAELTKKLREVEAEIQRAENDFQAQTDKSIRAEQEELEAARQQVKALEEVVRGAERNIKYNEEWIAEKKAEIENLRQQWHAENEKKFAAQGTCPTCGQPMPERIIEESRQRFNQQKADRLRDISEKGKALAEQVGKLQKGIEENQETIKRAQEGADRFRQKEKAAEENISSLNNTFIDLSEKWDKKTDLEKQIQALSNGDNKAAIEAAEAKIKYCDEQIEALQKTLARLDQYESAQDRIEELKAEEKKLAAEFEKIEHEQYLTDEFVRQKVNLLEEKINSYFSLVKWKLFDVQINGGLSETCVCLVGGVPYPSVNSAGKIQAGIDIISALSKYYGMVAPLWVDNREGIVELPETENQIISLVVSAKDKKLRIEKREQRNRGRHECKN